MNTVNIIGLGYVGLPIALEAADSGYMVRGFDIDKHRIKMISDGKSYIEGVTDSDVQRSITTGRFTFFSDAAELGASDVYVVCVPTPLDVNKKPDLKYLINAVDMISKVLLPGELVIIESTVAPGTVRNTIIPHITNVSGIPKDEIKISYSPERIDPGNIAWKLSNTPKLVSGIDKLSLNLALEFYSKFVQSIFECSSIEVAEMAKLLENTFRFVNISLINELSMFCRKLDIDILEIIQAASTKPYGFMPFYPSVGVGGHCIPVDPIYLAQSANSVGTPIRIIDLADKVNQEMPEYFVARAEERLNGLTGKKIIVIGVAYKPNVSDVRESSVKDLLTKLKSKGAIVRWHDELVKEWNGEKSVPLSDGYDLAILATPHNYLDLKSLGNIPILNTKS